MAVLAAVPGVSCSGVAGAIGAGLGSLCGVASGITGLGVDSILSGLVSWVGSGAVWLLGQVGSLLDATTSIDLGASWFTVHDTTMMGLAGVLIVPMLLFGMVQAIASQSPTKVLRLALVHVPLALLLTAVAVKLVQLGLAVTDAMSTTVAEGSGVDVAHALSTVVGQFTAASADPSVPSFVLLVVGLVVAVGAFLLWMELVMRSAAVYVAVLFLPLALASLAWPAISHWCRRLVDTLVALVLGKFVIVAVLSLAVGALAGGLGSTPAGASGDQGGGVSSVVTGAALLLLAAGSPWALFRLLPFAATAAVSHLEGAGRQGARAVAGPIKSLAESAMTFAGTGPGGVTGALARAMSGGEGAGPAGRPGGGAGGGSSGGAAPDQGEGLGSAGGPRGGGAPSAGGHPDGGAGPGGDGPDLGPSSMTQRGVGSATAPGAGIPHHRVHPEAGEAYEAGLQGEVGGGRPDDPAPEGGAGRSLLDEAQRQEEGPARPEGPGPDARPTSPTEPISGVVRQRTVRRPVVAGERGRGPPVEHVPCSGSGGAGAGRSGARRWPVSGRVNPPARRAERVRYHFGPLERRGVVAGWRGGQIALVAAGLGCGMLALRSRPSVVGVVVGLAFVGIGVAGACWPVGGRTGDQWLPLVVRWLGTGGRRGHDPSTVVPGRGRMVTAATGPLRSPLGRSSGTEPGPGFPAYRRGDGRPPKARGVFGGLRIVPVPAGPDGGTSPMGMIVDTRARTATAVLAVRGQSFALLGPVDQDARIAGWARVLASMARQGSEVHRVQWIESCLPDDGTAVRLYWRQHAVLDAGTDPDRSYEALVDEAMPVTRRHRVLVAVSLHLAHASRAVRASGGGMAGAGTVLARTLRSLHVLMEDADLVVEGVLGPALLASVVREASAPLAQVGLPEPSALAPWPLATETSWDAVRTDGTWHATYWVAEWPRVDVTPDFLGPLLFSPVRRSLSLVMEPVSPLRAARQVAQARTADIADGELRRRGGFVVTARHAREREGVEQRDVELADGHAQFRFSGYVTVTAESRDELRHACAAIEQAAGQARMELRLLYGEQDVAFACTLPLGRGLA